MKEIKQGSNFVTLKQFDKKSILLLLESILDVERSDPREFDRPPTRKSLICNLFYEPSTRTSSSFIAAAKYLGHDVLSINNVQFSSVSKGETLEDTIRTLASYTHCIVLRHPEVGSASRAAKISNVPIINAGDGAGEHPTQTLLDLYTIYKHFGRLDNLVITLMGDLKYGRTVHSLIDVLQMFNSRIHLVSPPELRLPDTFNNGHLKSETHIILTPEVLANTDVLYITRVQTERGAVGNYQFTAQNAVLLNTKAIVMHPLPRKDELSVDFDNDPRAKYFEQMSNGLVVRKYLLGKILG